MTKRITGEKLRRAAAMILALALAMAFLAGCGPAEDGETTTTAAAETVGNTVANNGGETTETTTDPNGESEAISDTSDISDPGESTPGEETDPPTTPGGETILTTTTAATQPKLPQTKAEILAAYTAVVNKVKADAPQYVSNDWQTMSNIDMNGFTYGVISPIAKSFLETKEESTPGTHTAGNHPKWFALPTDTHKVGCVLTDTSKITAAKCVKSGNNYVITITLAEEKDPVMKKENPYNAPGWHGKMFDVIDITEVTEIAKNLPGVNADNAYCTFKGTATLTYDPVTNQCIKLDHVIDVRVYLGAGAAKVIADYHFYDFKW